MWWAVVSVTRTKTSSCEALRSVWDEQPGPTEVKNQLESRTFRNPNRVEVAGPVVGLT
jgi:hypothetical protein